MPPAPFAPVKFSGEIDRVLARDNRDIFLKWLTKGMRGVSRHCRDQDVVVLDVQTLIYPRYDLEQTT